LNEYAKVLSFIGILVTPIQCRVQEKE